MTDSWLTGCLSKRSPDAMRILCDLLEAGLRNGTCSANDIRPIVLAQPNVIGCVFKLLKNFGFIHTEKRIKTTAAKKHGRRVDVYLLTDTSKAIEAVNRIRSMLIRTATDPQQTLGF